MTGSRVGTAIRRHGIVIAFFGVTALVVGLLALALDRVIDSGIRDEALNGAEGTARTFAELNFQSDEFQGARPSPKAIHHLKDATNDSAAISDAHLATPTGEIILGHRPPAIADPFEPEEVEAARAGELWTEVTTADAEHVAASDEERELELIAVNVPLGRGAEGRPRAILAVYMPYAPVAAQIDDASRTANLAVAGAAAALLLVLLPGVRRGSRALRETMDPAREFVRRNLPRAMARGEIILHYQPKLALQSDRVIGAEALVRWQHPTKGLIPPGEFLAAAERLELIDDLTLHVARLACRQMHAWRAGGIDLPVAINISSRNFRDDDLPQRLAAIAEDHLIPPDRITIEVTESAAFDCEDDALKALDRFRRAGFHISMDDFGRGESSLLRLSAMPLLEVKLDRGFVGLLEQGRDATVVEAIVELVHRLGLVVVAEGVETESVLERLRALGCDAAQGYHILRPCPAEDLERWLRERERTSAGATAAAYGTRLRRANLA